jgi:H(+)-translocating pyrophosphatase
MVIDATVAARWGQILIVPLVGALLGSVTMCCLSRRVMNSPAGDGEMAAIAKQIQDGAKAFLKKEYTYLAIFVSFMAIVIGVAQGASLGIDGLMTFDGDQVSTYLYGFGFTMPSFIIGALLSGLCGWLGMLIAVHANVRTCEAAKTGLNEALKVSFASGGVMGLSCTSLGLLGLVFLYGVIGGEHASETLYLAGFGFGASAIALFARVGGGIYTKAADVGADLVGKVEQGIPEDDPRNPATIADNVGDNVGDVAGMGADLFESFVGSIIASMQLAPEAQKFFVGAVLERNAMALPFWIAGFGIVCSIIGIFLVRTKEGIPKEELQESLLGSIRRGIMVASALSLVTSLVSCGILLGWGAPAMRIWGCVAIGLVAGVTIGTATEYATSFSYFPTQSIARKSLTGPATVVIQGLGVGMLSTVPPVLVVFASILGTFALSGVYGIAIAAVGMLSTLGVTLATDAFGPVADNAGGIAEMAELDEEVRERTDGLDALGNTTAATGKGFAIGSAALSALALLIAFKNTALSSTTPIDIAEVEVLCGLLFGAMLPFVFAALTMLAVGRSATAIIVEVRRQFAGDNGAKIMAREMKPDAEKCVTIATQAALVEMVIPGVITVVSPLFLGFLLGPKGLAGVLVGALVSGFMLAVSMANAGGAWDNAKKWVEAEGLGKKEAGLAKGSRFHEATIIGDTIGDPFKDTSGPSLNVLIKLMSLISLVFAPVFKHPSLQNYGLWYVALIIGVALILFIVTFLYLTRNTNTMDFDAVIAEQKQKAGVELSQVDHDTTEPARENVGSDDEGDSEVAPLTGSS